MDRHKNIPVGYSNIHDIISEFKKGKMIVLPSSSSTVKTDLAIDITNHMAITEGKTVLYFSLKMSKEQLTRCLICSLAKTSEKDFYDNKFDETEFNDKWNKVIKAASELQGGNVFIDSTPDLSINDLRAKVLKLNRQTGLDLIVIDDLQLMKGDIDLNDIKLVEVCKISSGIKALAKESDIPILVLEI